jgi:uncharacterized membrane protein (UPF0127 family)
MIQKIYVEENEKGFSFVYSHRKLDWGVVVETPSTTARSLVRLLIALPIDIVFVGKKATLEYLQVPEPLRVEI